MLKNFFNFTNNKYNSYSLSQVNHNGKIVFREERINGKLNKDNYINASENLIDEPSEENYNLEYSLDSLSDEPFITDYDILVSSISNILDSDKEEGESIITTFLKSENFTKAEDPDFISNLFKDDDHFPPDDYLSIDDKIKLVDIFKNNFDIKFLSVGTPIKDMFDFIDTKSEKGDE